MFVVVQRRLLLIEMRVRVCDMTQSSASPVHVTNGFSHREHFKMDIECLLVLAQIRKGSGLVTERVGGTILIIHRGKDFGRFAVEIECLVVVAEGGVNPSDVVECDALAGAIFKCPVT